MRPATFVGFVLALAALFALALPMAASTGQPGGKYTYNPPPFQNHAAPVSGAVAVRWYLENPESAPPQMQAGVQALREATEGTIAAETAAAVGSASSGEIESASPGLDFGQKRFNKEKGETGLPQNEGSVAFCRVNKSEVLGGTNDFRGLIKRTPKITGWHYSNDGGSTVLKEGLQRGVTIDGITAPTGGDPVVRAVKSGPGKCDFYEAGLAFAFTTSFSGVSGIVVHKSTSATLNGTCTGAACWPSTKLIAGGAFGLFSGSFLDKPWMDVGKSGGKKRVWVTYTDFDLATGRSPIRAVRCNLALTRCTDPILISRLNADAQASYVTIARDGRVYVSWIEVTLSPDGFQVFRIKMRVAPAGSTTFGPTKTVFREKKPLPFGAFLSANDFPVLTIPKNTVLPLGGAVNRFYVIWDFCVQPTRDIVCRDSDIRIRFTDDDGSSFTTRTIAKPNNQYFSSIDADVAANRVYIAFLSNEGDVWNHRYKVVLRHSEPDLESASEVVLNSTFNEPNADPLFGGLFIGDYLEVTAHSNTALVHYNANYTTRKFLDTKPPTNQQDNYMAKFTNP